MNKRIFAIYQKTSFAGDSGGAEEATIKYGYVAAIDESQAIQIASKKFGISARLMATYELTQVSLPQEKKSIDYSIKETVQKLKKFQDRKKDLEKVIQEANRG